jgi:hypothetical protein
MRQAITVEEAARVIYMNMAMPGGPLDIPGPSPGNTQGSRMTSPRESVSFAERPPIDAFLLCRDDPTSVVRRVFLPPKVGLFSNHDFGDNEILRMWDYRITQKVQVVSPPDTNFCELEYNGLLKVKEAADKVVSMLNVPKDELSRFGLYFPGKGIWLDDNKQLASYEFGPHVRCFIFIFFIFFFFSSLNNVAYWI